MFVASSYLALAFVKHTWAVDRLASSFTHLSVIFILMWLVFFERIGLYKRSFALSVKDEFYYTVAALTFGILPQLTIFTIVPSLNESRLALVLSFAIAVITVGGARSLAHAARNATEKRRPRRIAIVGAAGRIASVAESLDIIEGTEVLRLDVPDMDASVRHVTVGSEAALQEIDWFRTATLWGCDTLLLTEILPPQVMPHVLEVAASKQIKVAFAPPRIQCHAYSLTLMRDGEQALIVPSRLRSCTPSARLLKRLLDLAVAVPAIILFSPVMACIALAIRLESGSPVIFRQRRVGRGGGPFWMLKFRSMRVDAESETGPVWAVRGDSRITKVGAFLRRTSLDELPQLFNVLDGGMSIVGPRPELPNFVEEFRRLLPRYDERHLVRPGITGWSQVNMKRTLDVSDAGDVLDHDLFYVEHWSLFMDLSVIFKTALEVLFHRPA